MARTTYISIDPELEPAFYANLVAADRFQYGKISRKVVFVSRRRKKGLTQKSLLPVITPLWNAFTQSEKDAWAAAGATMGLNGWRMFLSDQAARIVNEISGVATPSLLHQSWVGNLHIASPASELEIEQVHPHRYWIAKNVTGKKSMKEPVLVTEDFALPVTFGFNYASNLTSVGTGSYAHLRARVLRLYQGVNHRDDYNIDLDLVSDWVHVEQTINSAQGLVILADLVLHLYNVTGDLWFDHVKLTHSGQNWARDPYCYNIKQSFTKAYFQVPRHWAPITLPSGAQYESVYYNG